MAFPYHVGYRLFRRRWALAAEVEASEPSRRAWVGVYPLGSTEDQFRVWFFEYDKAHLAYLRENGYEFEDDKLLNSEMVTVTGEVELERVLRQRVDDLEKLVQPFFCDFPPM